MDAPTPQELLRGNLIALSIDRPVVYGPFLTYADAIRECRAAGGNDRFVVMRLACENEESAANSRWDYPALLLTICETEPTETA